MVTAAGRRGGYALASAPWSRLWPSRWSCPARRYVLTASVGLTDLTGDDSVDDVLRRANLALTGPSSSAGAGSSVDKAAMEMLGRHG